MLIRLTTKNISIQIRSSKSWWDASLLVNCQNDGIIWMYRNNICPVTATSVYCTVCTCALYSKK